MSDNTKLNSSAHQKPTMLNPGTIKLVKITKAALIIKVNRPKLKILMGKVRMIKIGLRNILINPSTKAAIKAATKDSTSTAGIKYAAIIIAKVEINHLTKNFIVSLYYLFNYLKISGLIFIILSSPILVRPRPSVLLVVIYKKPSGPTTTALILPISL